MAVDDRRRTDVRALQVSAWRGQEHVVVLSPAPDRPAPTAAVVASAVDRLRTQGIQRILTGALHPGELAPFLGAGFVEHERLHLLRHDLIHLPTGTAPGPTRQRRGRRGDRPAVLGLDRRAFDDFWTLDERGLTDAIRATPSSRFRVALDGRGPIVGYAITGQAADRGYLQRLAVDPDRHRAGIGRALVADCLRWLSRHGSRVALVNTQEGNASALGLYEACGFVLEPRGLTVLHLDLPTTTT